MFKFRCFQIGEVNNGGDLVTDYYDWKVRGTAEELKSLDHK